MVYLTVIFLVMEYLAVVFQVMEYLTVIFLVMVYLAEISSHDISGSDIFHPGLFFY